jgi:hypothetical protein
MASILGGIFLMLVALVLWLVNGGLFAPAAGAVGIALFCIGIDLIRLRAELGPKSPPSAKELARAAKQAEQAKTQDVPHA